jgi:hypothetical protein
MIEETNKKKSAIKEKRKVDNAEKNKERRTFYAMEKIFAGGVANNDFRRKIEEE